MAQLPDPLKHRTADHPIEDLFLRRWSPRAMSGEAISEGELMSLFEAARWAPSTYNEQEWRFLYASRDSEHWETFFNCLVEANQAWCKNAAALIVCLSCKMFSRNGKPNPVHTFDCGLATENLLLQATTMNLVSHAMAGFDRSKARVALNVPDNVDIEVMVAIGRPSDADVLPEDYRDMDKHPSGRKPLSEIVASGPFSF
ncbi:MAG: nitroreductase family protein [Planctomycetaceae bacterium]|nr:nitroreductase family protein [Planctomycetaceae bacterium]